MQRLTFIIIGLLLAITLPAGAAKENPFNVDVFFGWDGYYRPMEWTPFTVEAPAPGDKPIDSTVTLSAVQNELNRLTVHRRATLEPGKRKTFHLTTRLAVSAESFNVTITERTGRQRTLLDVTRQVWSGDGQSPMTALDDADALLEQQLGEDRAAHTKCEHRARHHGPLLVT